MSQDRSDVDSEPQGQDREAAPGAVSNQNGEEAESGLRDAGGQAEPETENGDAHREAGSAPGAAGEGSQATGHRGNAG